MTNIINRQWLLAKRPFDDQCRLTTELSGHQQ